MTSLPTNSGFSLTQSPEWATCVRNTNIRVVSVPNADHTFSRAVELSALCDLILRWIPFLTETASKSETFARLEVSPSLVSVHGLQ